jgi:hypothetical protein
MPSHYTHGPDYLDKDSKKKKSKKSKEQRHYEAQKAFKDKFKNALKK